MPVYEYECKACGRDFEYQQRMSDPDKTTCEVCGGALDRLISRTAFSLKGGGWYKDLYASPKPETARQGRQGRQGGRRRGGRRQGRRRTRGERRQAGGEAGLRIGRQQHGRRQHGRDRLDQQRPGEQLLRGRLEGDLRRESSSRRPPSERARRRPAGPIPAAW